MVFDVTRPETLQQVILIIASCLIRNNLKPTITKLWYGTIYALLSQLESQMMRWGGVAGVFLVGR